MSLLDIFTPSWKKQFDEFATAHHNALVAFLQNRYEVYPDMRIDDRIIIEEYKRNYDSSKYPTNIEELTNNDKKELIAIADQIIRLAKVFSKYDSSEKRVKSLYDRFRMNGIFDSVFKETLGCDYDINTLSASQIEEVLSGYDKLVEKAFYYKEEKLEKQEKLKEKLMAKVYERKVINLLDQQKCFDKPLALYDDNKVVRNILKEKIDILKSKYSEFNAYRLVRRILLLGFNDFTRLSKDIYILSREYVFEESFKTFSMIEQFPIRKKYFPLYLMSVETNDCLEKLFLNHNFEDLDEYAHNELQQSTGSWIENQNEFNENIIDISKSIIPELRHPRIATHVTIVNSDSIKESKRFSFVHFMLCEYVKNIDNISVGNMSPYTTYISTESYRKMTCQFDISNQSITKKILNFLLTLKTKEGRYFYKNPPLVVVLGSSGFENERDFNKYHFKDIIDKLIQKNVPVVEYFDIDKIYVPKHIVVLELFTEVNTLKENCQKLLYKFPGVSICYLSIYNEMTKKRYEKYQNSI